MRVTGTCNDFILVLVIDSYGYESNVLCVHVLVLLCPTSEVIIANNHKHQFGNSVFVPATVSVFINVCVRTFLWETGFYVTFVLRD
jgi:hypothetical protein